MTEFQCPHCGHTITGSRSTGRPRLNIDVNNVLDALRTHRSVVLAAKTLECSRGTIYQRLKDAGLAVGEVL